MRPVEVISFSMLAEFDDCDDNICLEEVVKDTIPWMVYQTRSNDISSQSAFLPVLDDILLDGEMLFEVWVGFAATIFVFCDICFWVVLF